MGKACTQAGTGQSKASSLHCALRRSRVLLRAAWGRFLFKSSQSSDLALLPCCSHGELLQELCKAGQEWGGDSSLAAEQRVPGSGL